MTASAYLRQHFQTTSWDTWWTRLFFLFGVLDDMTDNVFLLFASHHGSHDPRCFSFSIGVLDRSGPVVKGHTSREISWVGWHAGLIHACI
jgi:hypothetical protein